MLSRSLVQWYPLLAGAKHTVINRDKDVGGGDDMGKMIIIPLNDPLLGRLSRRFHLDNPYIATGIGFILGFIGYIAIPALEGVLLPSKENIASLAAWPLIYVWLIAIPFIFGYYLSWQIYNANQTFLSLLGVLTSSKKRVESSMTEYWEKFSNKPWWILSVVLAIFGTFLHAREATEYSRASNIWYTVNNSTSFYYFRVPVVFLTVYMVAQILFGHIVFILTLRRLFKEFRIKIHILHPDRAGGLGQLGKYSLFMSYFLANIALVIVTLNIVGFYIYKDGVPLDKPSMIVMLIAYSVLSPLVFFLPLSIAHNVMKQAKEEALLEISIRSLELFEQSQKQINLLKDLEAQLKDLEAHEKFYVLVNKFPVWPFDITTISRFMVAVVGPFSPFITTLLIDFVKRHLFDK